MTKETSTLSKSALFFELDSVALGARRIRCEVLAGILREQGVELDEITFAKHALHLDASLSFLPAFLESLGYAGSADQVLQRLLGETTSRLMQKDAGVNPALVPWLDAARARNATVCAVSLLPTADEIAKHVGLERWNASLFVPAAIDKPYPHADYWLRAVKSIGKIPLNCLAIVSSAESAKVALSVGMNVVAVPDSFTSFQDFSGVNYLCNSLSDLKPDRVFDELKL